LYIYILGPSNKNAASDVHSSYSASNIMQSSDLRFRDLTQSDDIKCLSNFKQTKNKKPSHTIRSDNIM